MLVLVGSLRAASVNRQIAELAAESAPDGVRRQLYDGLGELPFYNEDIDNDERAPRPSWRCARRRREADAALVVTPEYNGSIPGVLKNAIDWLSRPFGNRALKGKPLAVDRRGARAVRRSVGHDETRKSFGIAGPRVVEESSCRCRQVVRRQASARERRVGRELARRRRKVGRRSR